MQAGEERMRVMAGRWGGSVSVRVAATAVAAARLHPDQPIDLQGRGRIVIEQVPAEAYDLAVLIAAITDENRHEALGTGWPWGQDAW